MRRGLPVVLAVVLVVSLVVAVRAGSGVGRGPAGPSRLRTPVLSVRRAPGFLSQVVADVRLRGQLDAALDAPALDGARDASCLIVRQGSRLLMERRPSLQLVPASNLKLLTSLAVLNRLGPSERLVTEVRGSVTDGVVAGPLWMVGGGDPLLSTADYLASFENQPQVGTSLEALADAVVAAGVKEVRGGVVGDETRYDAVRYVPTWKPNYITDFESGPASALLVNDGFEQYRPRHVAAAQPDVAAAGALAALLQARGVVVAGGVGEGKAPDGPPLAHVESPPLSEVVGEMLRESDNLTAEMLVKELGYRLAGDGSTAAGLKVVRDALTKAGLDVTDLVTLDGSGLDRSDRATCGLLLTALKRAGASGPVAAGLPVAAKTGTLAKRFDGSPAAGRLRAKTGSLDGVTALTGYVDEAGKSQPLAFAMLANNLPRDAVGRALQDQVGAALARYPDAPAPDALAP